MKKKIIAEICGFIFALAAGAVFIWNLQKKADLEISYTKTLEKHIVPGEFGQQYVDNELIVTVKEGVKKEKIEKLAEKYHASVGGYIAVSGTSQWVLDEVHTETELEELRSDIEEEEEIESAALNRGIEIESSDADETYIPKSPEWKHEKWDDDNPSGNNSYLEIIRADKAWEILSKIPGVEEQAVKIGLIDTIFDSAAEKEQCKSRTEGDFLYYSKEDNEYKGNKDLDFAKTFYNPGKTLVKNQLNSESHGSQVAAIMAATFDKEKKNAFGISGIYPYGAGNLYGVNWMDKESGVQITQYDQKVYFATLLQEGVQVINCSYADLGVVYCIPCMEDNADGEAIRREAQRNYAEGLAEFLGRYLERGYDFVIVSAAGNFSQNYHRRLNTNVGKKYFKCVEENDNSGSRRYKWEEAKETENVYSGSVDAKYIASINAIEDVEVRSRILVVGSCIYNEKTKQYHISDYSNIGETVDILAPGDYLRLKKYDGGYEEKQGTSFAAPLVAGTAAMMWTANPDMSGAEIKNLMIESSHARTIHMEGRRFAIYDKKGENPSGDVAFRSIGAREYPILDAGEAVKRAVNYKCDEDTATVILSAVEGEKAHAEIIWKGEEDYLEQKKQYTDPESSLYIQAEIYDKDGTLIASCDGVKNWEVRLQPGVYTLKAAADGYEPIKTEDFEIHNKQSNGKIEVLNEIRRRLLNQDNKKIKVLIGLTMEKSEERHFEVIPRKMSWIEARDFCEELGGQLAKADSEAINTQILGYFQNPMWNQYYDGNGCWLGASDADNSTWNWIDGKSMDYENWSIGNPDGQGEGDNKEQYLEMIFNTEGMNYKIASGEWNDTTVNNPDVKAFACEWSGSNTHLTREQEEFLKNVVYAAYGQRKIDFQKNGASYLAGYLLEPWCLQYLENKYGPAEYDNGYVLFPENTINQVMEHLLGIENGAEALVKAYQNKGWKAEIRGDQFAYMSPSKGYLFDTDCIFKRYVKTGDQMNVDGSIIKYDGEGTDAKVRNVTDFTMTIQISEDNTWCEGIRLLDYKEKMTIPQEALSVLNEKALNCTADERDTYSLDGFISMKPFQLQGKEYLFGIYMNGDRDEGRNHPYFVVIDKGTGELVDQLVWGGDGDGFFEYRTSYISAADMAVIQREKDGQAEFVAYYAKGLLDGSAEYFKIIDFNGENLDSSWEMTSASGVGGSTIYEDGVLCLNSGMLDPSFDQIMTQGMETHNIKREMLLSDEDYDGIERICRLQAKGKSLYGSSGLIFEGDIMDYTELEKHWTEYQMVIKK